MTSLIEFLRDETAKLHEAGLYKTERLISSHQRAGITVERNGISLPVINLCANNYLGLADDPRLIKAAHDALDRYGYGMASVRFICGTQTVHKELEDRISRYLGTEDTILYSSCFDANAGLFETLLGEEDAIISDALNHASIIDGIRLCKAKRLRYANNDMNELEDRLKEAASSRFRLIATDGVFSMDGSFARLPEICDLAEKYNALVMVDDSHAVGFVGPKGRGTPAKFGVADRVHINTGTLGKALGGASGGYTSGRKEIVEWLRQRSRPYLFSNTLAPVIAATSIAAIDLIEQADDLREKLDGHAQFFRREMTGLGFSLLPGEHPIVPVMLGDEPLAVKFAGQMYDEGVYVVGFCYPVVPKGKARIRTQMSARLTREQLQFAVSCFAKVGEALGLLGQARKAKA